MMAITHLTGVMTVLMRLNGELTIKTVHLLIMFMSGPGYILVMHTEAWKRNVQ